MNIKAHLEQLLPVLLSSHSECKIQNGLTKAQLIQTIDLTLLDENASNSALAQLHTAAQTHHIAALCLLPFQLEQLCQSETVSLATVVNFPQGNDSLAIVLSEIEKAQRFNVKEIDYVIPYQAYLDGKKDQALAHYQEVAQYCEKNGLTLKVILETGAFLKMDNIYQLSKELIAMGGCHFLKTSTGKIAQGASLSAVFAMLSAIKESNNDCGIKISGGIKTPEQAYQYAYLAELMTGKKINKNWFRIGASSLLDHLIS